MVEIRRTEGDEAAKKEGPHSFKVILRTGKRVRATLKMKELRHTLDWKVNRVKPRKTPIVMSLEKG